MASEMLQPGSTFHAVDQWAGHPGEANQNSEPDFDYNMGIVRAKFSNVTIVKHKSDTVDATAALINGKLRNSFDLVYVDGVHTARGVLEDLTHSFPLCRPGGIIICDDYTWAQNDNAVDRRPKMGIDNFANTYADMIELIPYQPTYQIFFRKRLNSNMIPL